MVRLLCAVLMVVLVCAFVGATGLACSVEEGCLEFSDLLDDRSYEIEVVDAGVVVSTPYLSLEAHDNRTSYPNHQSDLTYSGLFGWGITKGSKWWQISLGVKEFEVEDVEMRYGYIAPPHSRVILSAARNLLERAVNIKIYQLYRCNEHRQLWKHYCYEGLAFDSTLWTDISIEIEPLGTEDR